ncbi:sulfotransferase [Rhodanobacter lindaniclasticus]
MRDRAAGLPAAATALLGRAEAALQAQDPQAAEAALDGVLALLPDCAEALRMQGLVRHLRGDYVGAVALLRRAQALLPDDPLVCMNLATAMFAADEREAAVSCLQRCCAMAPGFAPAWFNLGKMYMLQQRPAGAVTALHRALDAEPGHVPARMLLAQAQASLGALEPAARNYREVLRLQPDQADAWIGLADLESEPFSPTDVAQLEQLLGASLADPRARVCLGFALTRALEDQGDHAGAFRALRKANALMYRQVGWSPARAAAQAQAMRRAFDVPLAGAADARLGEGVVFVVGMPQAGSRLTAQVLAAHPAVAVLDEPHAVEQVLAAETQRRQQPRAQWMAQATPADWQRLGQDYLRRTEPMRGRKTCLVDRTPDNWRLVGAIRAMLPGARVVDSRRRALATCFACYRQLFLDRHEFSYELDHVAGYWGDYDALCRHWRQLFPDRFIEHHYEAWHADPALQVRRLLAFCALPFAPACVDVPQGRGGRDAGGVAELMQRDDARCAAYGKQLNRLRALLRMRGVDE